MNISATSAVELPETPVPPVDAAADTDVEVNLAPAELLIVDDDPATLERLQLLAEDAGYSVRTARNGVEALESLRENFCALILADIAMPIMSGTSLCAAIRAAPFPSYVYAIALSARDDPDDIVAAFDSGADDFLSKQASRSELFARLRAGRRVVGLEQSLRGALNANRALCHVDALTRCFNKRYLIPALERELVRSRQHGHWVSVLMCSIDGFQRVNDKLGYAVGDEILQEVAQRINALSLERGAVWLAYFGDDTFVVVMPETPIEQACAQAEHIVKDFHSKATSCSAGALPLTLSIGVCGAGPSELRRRVAAGDMLIAVEDCTRDSIAAGRDTVTARAFRPRSARVKYLVSHVKGKKLQ